MKSVALACVLCSACLDNPPPSLDEVISKFQADGDPTTWVADGHTPITIDVCTSNVHDLDPKLTATLKSSTGTWQIPDSDAKSTTVPMSAPCETRAFTPDTQPGTISLTATIGTFTKEASVTVVPACVTDVRLGRQGTLSTTAASMLTISATLDVANAGKPSIGTIVNFDVTVDTPAGGTASFGQDMNVIASGSNSVQSPLFVSQGVTKLTVTASATPENCAPTTSESLEIVP